jgi:hypothetical protein
MAGKMIPNPGRVRSRNDMAQAAIKQAFGRCKKSPSREVLSDRGSKEEAEGQGLPIHRRDTKQSMILAVR